MKTLLSVATGLLVALINSAAPAADGPTKVRVATFNVSLFTHRAGELAARLQGGDDPQAGRLAEIIQRVRPDVILLNEIDVDEDQAALAAFCDQYLGAPQNSLGDSGEPTEPIEYPHRYTAPVNTGRHSGFDLDRNGVIDATPGGEHYAGDCWGYGEYPGQYGMAVLSKHPIDAARVRTFQQFRWRDMPDARLPDDPQRPGAGDWYPAPAIEQFPLSSKSHWDVPIVIDGAELHLLASHPTPPVYDGAEDRNGRRNHDEIRFWADYVGEPAGAAYIYDDEGQRGGLNSQVANVPAAARGGRSTESNRFVILGDLNGDPHDGDGPEGIALLLASPAVLKYPPPASAGAAEQARLQGGANRRHRGDPSHDTADPPDDPGPGNLRIDYVLPSANLAAAAAGVFWPTQDDRLFPLVGVHPFPSSDHRLVWVDVEF